MNFDPTKAVVKTGSMLVCRPCDLNKTSVREKSTGVYLPIGRVFRVI